jgi:hypothetical protein
VDKWKEIAMTQKEMILMHMREHGSINPQEAMIKYGIYRLAARINDMRRDGIEINREIVVKKKACGDRVMFASYSLAS